MIRTTTQQLIQSIRSEPGGSFRPMQIGANLDQAPTGGSPKTIFTVPPGQVFLITDVVAQANQYTATGGTFDTSPQVGLTFTGVDIDDTAGVPTMLFQFKGFQRWANTFWGTTPVFQNTPPMNPVRFRPKYPVPVPAGFTIAPSGTIGAMGNAAAVYGFCVSTDAARTLGFPGLSSGTATDLQCGVLSIASASSATAPIAARTGKALRIMDIRVRLQAETNTDNVLVLEQYDGSTSVEFLRVVNNNPAEMIDFHISPDIFLKPGATLRASTTVARTASINIVYEWVDADEVPGDHFWAVTIPERPTPGAGIVGTLFTLSLANTEVTLYYPRRDYEGDAAFTKTSPGKGYQHLIEGYVISVQKETIPQNNAADDTEQTLVTLTTGDNAGAIRWSAGGVTQPNYQLAPVFSATGHDGNLCVAVDDVLLPCEADDGSLWVTASNAHPNIINLTSPQSTTADISNWAVCVWGRTIDKRWQDKTNVEA